MSLEPELQRRLEASASAFDPDPAVLAEAERRAERRLRAQRTTRSLVAAAVVLIAGVVALIVVGDGETRNPIVDSPPLEREDGDETPDTDPDVPPIDEEAPQDEDPGLEDPDDDGADAGGTDVDPAGTWASLPPSPLAPRSGAAATWTGDQVFVWGGWLESNLSELATDGAFYDPSSGDWDMIFDAPTGLADATAVWTGEEVLVFGGADQVATPADQDTLLAYDPTSGVWDTEQAPPLEPRAHASVTWTGDELIVWGGATFGEPDDSGLIPVQMHADGAAFDPESRTWRTLADAPISARGDHGAVWNGRRLVIFGGGAADQIEGEFAWFDHPEDAAAYDPATDTWATIEAPGGPGPIVGAHWTGERIVYWTGHVTPDAPDSWLETGGVWDTSTGEVVPMATPPFDGRRDQAPTVWAAQPGRLVTWGGAIWEGGNHHWHTGASYDPEDDTWAQLADSPLGARAGHVTVWTGEELIVWGGTTDGFEQADEGGWTPEYELRDDGAIWRLEAPED